MIVALFLAMSSSVWAAVPAFVTYSGRLTDGSGWGESTAQNLTFWLCETPDGDTGDCLWSEVHEAVPVEDGYFSVRLGDQVPLPSPFPESLWVAVAVDGAPPLEIRMEVGSVPFALNCGHLDGQTVQQVQGRICGGVECPELLGYRVYCNEAAHCEYVRQDASGWRQWDVWIYVSPGTFMMGSDADWSYSDDELPVHEVTIPEGFFIGKYEIVVEQYDACQAVGICSGPSTVDWDGAGWGTNSVSNGRETHPQNGLTWQQAADFCSWVAQDGRLPSEAEWEYAATGPVLRTWPWGDTPEPECSDATAVFDDNGGNSRPWGCNPCTDDGCSGTMAVGSKPAGLSWCGALDMAGNLTEWVEDWYHDSYLGAPADGSAWTTPTGSERVCRSGSFQATPQYIRTANRHPYPPGQRTAMVGARCARPVDP